MDSCLPEPAGRRTQGQIKRQTELGTLRQLYGGRAGGQAGRQFGEGVFGAWQTQGLIAGASPGLTLAPALKLQVGMLRQAWPLPYSSPWATPCPPPPISGALGRVLVGGCGASLSLPGHLGGIGPANGTGPVGLQPLVNTLGMELMVAGQDSEQLPHLKVTEADHTQSLLRLMAVRVKTV